MPQWINLRTCLFLLITVEMPWSGIVDSKGKHIFTFVKYCWIFHHRINTILHSHWHYMRVNFLHNLVNKLSVKLLKFCHTKKWEMLFSEALICMSLISGIYYIYVCLRLIGLRANFTVISSLSGFPWWLSGEESTCNAGDPASILGLWRSPGGGHATHSSILAWRIPRDRGAWCAAVHEVTMSA